MSLYPISYVYGGEEILASNNIRKKNSVKKSRSPSAGRSSNGKPVSRGKSSANARKASGSTAKGKTSGTKRPPQKSKSKSEKTIRKNAAELAFRRKEILKGFIMVAVSVFILLFYLFPGEKLWNVFHLLIWGCFGSFGLLIPATIIYCAVQHFRKKPTYRLALKVFLIILTLLLLSSTIYAFGAGDAELDEFGVEIINCFQCGVEHKGTGVLGGLLGILNVKMFGSVGGGIVSLLLGLLSFCVTFFALFINMIDRLKQPVSERFFENKAYRDQMRRQESEIRRQRRLAAQDEHLRQMSDAAKQKQKRKNVPSDNDEYRRLHKSPFYEPASDSSTPPRSTKPDTKANPDSYTPDYSGVDEIVPDIKPKRKRKKPQEPTNDYIDESVSVYSDNVDIDALLAQNDTDGFIDISAAIATTDASARAADDPMPSADTAPPPPEPPVKKDSKGKKKQADNTPFEHIDTAVTEGIYIRPPFTLLQPSAEEMEENISQELRQSAATLVDTLKSFGVQTTITNISRGPSVTRYELQPAAGVKISKITNLSDDIAMNLAATGVRIEAPIPGKSAVGIEVPNKYVSKVKMRELVESREFQNAKSKLTVALGKDISGSITLADLARMPHLLIAGSTGSGKSVCINSMLVSLLYKSSPDDVKLMLIDPKVVELGVYNGIPHLLVPVVTDPRKAAGALNWAVNEMLKRYNTFAKCNVRDMQSYNRFVDKQNAMIGFESDEPDTVGEHSFEEDEMLAQAQAEINQDKQAAPEKKQEPEKLEKMAQIVIVIDELADLMMAAPNEVEESICRLAQMARAAGMHLVIATQRPSVDVITGLIKANIPSRIAFAVKSQIDSRTILDTGGAEKLLGKGDMLYSPIGTNKPVRVQGCLVDDDEIEKIVEFIKGNKVVEYDTNVMDEIEKNAVLDSGGNTADTANGDGDPMMEQAIRCVVEAGQASTSLLQRKLRLGYARAGRLIDEMEQMGVVGPHEGPKPRQVLMTYQQWLERNMSQTDQ